MIFIKLIPLLSIIFSSVMQTSEVSLTIEISELRNSNGQICFELSDDDKNSVLSRIQKIDNKTCVIHIKNIKPGTYSFRYFHDENNNEELDTNLIGMPKEGFGFSNNAKGTFGPPSHEKTLFKIDTNTTQSCIAMYL